MSKIESYVQFLTHTIDDFRNFFKPNKQKESVTLTQLVNRTLEIIGKEPGYNKVSGLYVANANNKSYFLADTTVNVDPSAEDLSDIALQAADFAKKFEIEPRVAMLSYSNFGSSPGKTSKKLEKAVSLVKARNPELIIDGEIHANIALSTSTLKEVYPFSALKEAANVLIFPDLNSGNIAYKLLTKIGGAQTIGPILLGLSKSVHVVQNGESLNTIVDMVAIAVVDAQSKED